MKPKPTSKNTLTAKTRKILYAQQTQHLLNSNKEKNLNTQKPPIK
ncbi:MAG: hypothetical protein NDF54_04010 [archaeon GB-1867-035]|nr:hypothetical protein [Candidatus Culexmicrobium profundum]